MDECSCFLSSFQNSQLGSKFVKTGLDSLGNIGSMLPPPPKNMLPPPKFPSDELLLRNENKTFALKELTAPLRPLDARSVLPSQ